MTPFKLAFAIAGVCGALAGCTSTGQLTPTASAAITAAYNDVCNALPALAPASATMNADAKNAYAQAQTICAAGTPTNAVAAGVDILAVENALLPYFKKATALAPDQEIGKRRLNVGERQSPQSEVWRVIATSRPATRRPTA
jgi:hypothetical protein